MALHQTEKEELRRILSQHGHEAIDDFMAVLDTFLAVDDHPTVSELTRRLKARGFMYGEDFVREALEVFSRLGFAQIKLFEGQETRYEHKHLGQHHDHLICTKCGRVEEFVHPRIEMLQKVAAQAKGFIPLQHRLEIYGLCRECARSRQDVVPLCKAELGEKLVICGHTGGTDIQRRLNELGLRVGAEIELLGCDGGPVVVACDGSRLALGQGMSENVMVAPNENGCACAKREENWWGHFLKRKHCKQGHHHGHHDHSTDEGSPKRHHHQD